VGGELVQRSTGLVSQLLSISDGKNCPDDAE